MSDEQPPIRAFGDNDGDLRHLNGRTIAFIGYGNQGRAQALNLRDSGIANIIVGTQSDESFTQADADGFLVSAVAEAAERADVLFLLVPDEVLPDVFAASIAQHLQAKDAIVFASGYNLTYEGVALPSNVDVLLLAPRMIGRQLRKLYERGEGFYSYVSVEQNASGNAWPLVLALAKGIGTLRLGAFELSARDETLLDLYGEQGLGALIGMLYFTALDVGLKAGIPAEALILDLYLSGEMAETFEAMAEFGFVEQSRLHSLTSQYGGMTRSMRVDREALRKHLESAIDEIKSGAFAKEWAAERASGYENFNRFRELGRQANPFEPIEQRIRDALKEAQARRETSG
ncbi:MAG: ketol-acid reductoisomerase [Dehalococcoidia bacterium]